MKTNACLILLFLLLPVMAAGFRYDFSKPDSIAQGVVKDLAASDVGYVEGDIPIVNESGLNAAYFNGSSYIRIPSLSNWDLRRSITISATVKFLDNGLAMGEDNAHDMIIAKDDYFVWGVWPGGGQRMCYFNTNNGVTWFHGATVYATVRPGVWMQLDARIKLLDKKKGSYLAEFFVDGYKLAETKFVNEFNQQNTNPVCVGYGFGGGCWLMHGYMANISLTDETRSDSKIIESVRSNPYISKKPAVQLNAKVVFDTKKSIARLTVDGTYIGNLDKAKAAYTLQDSAGNVLRKADITGFKEDKTEVTVDISKLKPGSYKFIVELQSGDKQFSDTYTWEKPDTALWAKAKAGVSNDVIFPWTPIVVHSRSPLSISCWNRTYYFQGSGLVQNVTTRGKQVLAAPITINATENGKLVRWEKSRIKTLWKSPAKTSFIGNAESKNLQISTDSYLEFDGMVLTKLTLKAKKSARVDKCYIDIPLKEENAKYISFLYPGNGSYRGTTQDAPRAIAFPYYMWLGDEDRGFCWFSERNMSKQVADQTKAVQIIRQAGKVTVRINLLDKSTTLEEPLTFTIGFQATPVKPLPEKWRSFVQNKVALVWSWPNLTKYFGYPEAADPVSYKQEVARVHGEDRLFVPYIGLQMLSSATAEYRYFGEQWTSGISDSSSADVISFDPPAPIYAICPKASEYVDAHTYHIKQLVDTYGIDGLYHDFSWPMFCRNTRHGCPEEGGFPILAMRELYKRTYTILKSQPRRTFEAVHTGWELVCAPVCSFSDATLNGEEISLNRGKGNYYKTFITKDSTSPAKAESLLSDYIGRQFGPIPIFWRSSESNPEYNKPEYEQRMLGIMLLHDVLTSWGYWQEGYGKMWKVLNEFGIDDVVFLPYWTKHAVRVTAYEPKPAEFSLSAPVLVSVYKHAQHKALVVVANTSEENLKAEVDIDSAALGLRGRFTVKDAYNPGVDLAAGRSVTVEIPKLEYRLLLVEEGK